MSRKKTWSWDPPLLLTFTPSLSAGRSWKKNSFDGKKREKAQGRKGLNERKEKQGKVNLITEARYGSNVS